MTQQELELPKGWVETKLGDIITSVKGKKPKTLGEKNLKNKNLFLLKYLTKNAGKISTNNIGLVEYFDKYQAFCFDLSSDSVLKGDLNFNYK